MKRQKSTEQKGNCERKDRGRGRGEEGEEKDETERERERKNCIVRSVFQQFQSQTFSSLEWQYIFPPLSPFSGSHVA